MAEQQSPFQGLGFYTEADARWFFGRTTERKIILAHLRTARLTLLYAESGVGKSSLLRAGVAARLRELATQGIGGSRAPRFVPVVFSAWKDEPVEDLIAEIARQVDALKVQTNGSSPSATVARSGLAATITAAAAALDARLVIILDQFEEHFSYRLGDSHPDRLADELAQCVNSPELPANFLIAVREDAYGRLGDLFSGRISNVYNNYLHLEYLTRDAAREAIEKPVELYNAEHDEDEAITLDDDLTEAVLDEVRRGHLELGARRRDRDGGDGWTGANVDEIETPFLQLVMTRLWDCELAGGSRVLRTTTLNGVLGGAETIVRNHVDRALTGLAGEELEAATDIFHDLVTPSGVKVAHTARDLAQMTDHSENTVGAVLDRLYEERIVRAVDPAPGTAQARYEIFHDRLAAPILDWRRQRENARLERAKQSAEQEAQTQRAQARRFRRRARIMLALAVSLLLLLIAVVVLLQYARDQSARASREQHNATYFGLTTRAQSQLATRPDISLLLNLAAYDQSPQPVAARSLVATLDAVKRSGAVGILHGHTDAVQSIAFSPVGRTLASASADKTIRLWTVSRGVHRPLGRPLRANGPLFSVAFSPNGQILASGGFNDVILWNVRRHAEQGEIADNSGAVTRVAFSRDGNELAAAGSNGTVLLWNMVTHRRTVLTVSSGKPVTSVAFSPNSETLGASSRHSVVLFDVATGRRRGPPLTYPAGNVFSIAFSPNGETLAVGGDGGTIVLWDLATHSPRLPELIGLHIAYSIAFSRDGQGLVAGGARTTMLWKLAGGSALGEPLTVRQGAVYSVAFSPDGRTFASAGAARTITVWNYPVGLRYGQPLVSRTRGATEAAISPDGRMIASGGEDGQIYLTNRENGRLQQTLHTRASDLKDLVYDPTGRLIAAAYTDGAIRLWDLANGRLLGALRGRAGPVFSIAFDPTGTRLVSGASDGTVQLWNVRTHSELGQPLQADLGTVYAVAFSPDGREVASGGEGRAIRLWNARTGQPLNPPLIAQDNTVFSLAFSPDGHLLASGGADDAIHLWRVGAHSYVRMHTLTGDSNYVRSVAFSPDGKTLASGSTDDVVRLWDVATGTQLGDPLIGHTASVETVAFSSDGQVVASGGSDHTVRLWQAVPMPSSFAALRAEVCGLVGTGLSSAEWSQYAPNIPYQRTCPRTTPG